MHNKNKEDQRVIFLNRAYNDFDMQASIMAEMAKMGWKNIEVIGIDADQNIAEPYTHELSAYLFEKYNIKSLRITQLVGCPAFVKFSSFLLSSIRSYKRKNAFLYGLLKPADFIVRNILKSQHGSLEKWYESFFTNWRDCLIFVDEVVFHQGRSSFIDIVVSNLISVGTPVFAIKTGHHIYKDENPAGTVSTIRFQKLQAHFFSVSGPIDEELETKSITHVPVKRFGNPRMNDQWIAELVQAVNALPAAKRPVPDRCDDKVCVTVMLSKINYGIEVEGLKDVLRRLAHNPKVELAIKPHTRGMKFDFMPLWDLPGAHLLASTPSTALIEWCDLVLFTGSSIAFQAMLRKKSVGYLKYIQKLETIFDTGNGCKVLSAASELDSYIDFLYERKKAGIKNQIDAEKLTFLQTELYAGSENSHIAGKIVDAVIEEIK